MKVFQSRISEISQLDNGIIRVALKNGILLQPEDLDENLKIYKEILADQPSGLFLLVFAAEGEATKESREKFADPKRAEIKRAEALVVLNVSQKIESNFYKNFFHPSHPVRIFSDEGEAIGWLNSFEAESKAGRYETSIATIQEIEDQLIKIEVKDNAIIDENGLKENLAVYQKIIPNGGYFISVFKDSNSASKGAKPSFESPNRTHLKKAEAFVIAGLANRIELEYYIHKTRQIYPTEVFEKEEDALKWLQTLKK